MKNENPFLTTHVGSLPRPDDLIEIMYAREDGVPIDRVAVAERIELAVDEARPTGQWRSQRLQSHFGSCVAGA
jgi:hypothetical protein